MFETFSLFIFKYPFHVFICVTFFQYHKSRKNAVQVTQNVTRLWKKSSVKCRTQQIKGRAHLLLHQSVFGKNTWLCIVIRLKTEAAIDQF